MGKINAKSMKIFSMQILLTNTGWPRRMTATSIFLDPESTTSRSARMVSRTASTSLDPATQFFSKNSLTAFSLRPPIALAWKKEFKIIEFFRGTLNRNQNTQHKNPHTKKDEK